MLGDELGVTDGECEGIVGLEVGVEDGAFDGLLVEMHSSESSPSLSNFFSVPGLHVIQ